MNLATTQLWIKQFGLVADREKRHRIWMAVGTAVAVALLVALTLYGSDYYWLSPLQRPRSPKHSQLKPSGTLGIRLGLLGLLFFLLIYLYPIRKQWAWLLKKGKTKNWLDYHVLLGLTAPILITFHASFKVQGIAGMAYWTMMALTASGLVGRYFYSQIPKSLSTAEASLKEMQDVCNQLVQAMHLRGILSASEIERSFALPEVEEVQKMSLGRALMALIRLDMTRLFKIWKLRRRWMGSAGMLGSLWGILPKCGEEVETAISAVRAQATLSKKLLFLSKTHRVFHLWHVVHYPFSFSFAILSVLHITVVLLLGYF